MINSTMPAAVYNDAELVRASLTGNRDAFGQIVARYQSLVCALAFSATGSLSQSEDLAQETFVAAWRQLADLREPEKLRSWLCRIARNLTYDALRQQGREPSHRAESLEELAEAPAPGPQPAEQTMSNEEQAILWRSLEQIPELYREPLVLFYREHQSIVAVAQNLELSEDVVKQRLARGRKMLQEQVLAMVEGALGKSNPGPAFTLAVLATLPALTFSAKAATMGAATKGGATVAGAGSLGWLGAILLPLLAFLNLFGIWRVSHQAARSPRERRVYLIYYPVLAGSIVVFYLLACWLLAHGDALVKNNPTLFASLMTGLILGYFLLIGWLSRWYNRAVKQARWEQKPVEVAEAPHCPVWEYRSRLQLLGLPLIHLRTGGWQNGKVPQPVKAWVAISDGFAFGLVFAYGSVAVAPVSIGACAVGLLAYGAMAVGGLAVGGFAFGLWAFGAFGFGWQASAGCAVAWNFASGGQYAIAHQYALGPLARAAQVNTEGVRQLWKSNLFLKTCWKLVPYFFWLMWLWSVPLMISMIARWRDIARKKNSVATQ